MNITEFRKSLTALIRAQAQVADLEFAEDKEPWLKFDVGACLQKAINDMDEAKLGLGVKNWEKHQAELKKAALEQRLAKMAIERWERALSDKEFKLNRPSHPEPKKYTVEFDLRIEYTEDPEDQAVALYSKACQTNIVTVPEKVADMVEAMARSWAIDVEMEIHGAKRSNEPE